MAWLKDGSYDHEIPLEDLLKNSFHASLTKDEVLLHHSTWKAHEKLENKSLESIP